MRSGVSVSVEQVRCQYMPVERGSVEHCELTMGKQLVEQILGQEADVALDLVVEHEPGRDRRLVLPPPPPPPLLFDGC
jgi:hypothetical protein